MTQRLISGILLLYPRRVREAHGPELAALIDDLIAHDGRSPTGLLARLAIDGMIQRFAQTATIRSIATLMAATCIGGLTASGLASATSFHHPPQATSRPAAHVRQSHDCQASGPSAPHLTVARGESLHAPDGECRVVIRRSARSA